MEVFSLAIDQEGLGAAMRSLTAGSGAWAAAPRARGLKSVTASLDVDRKEAAGSVCNIVQLFK